VLSAARAPGAGLCLRRIDGHVARGVLDDGTVVLELVRDRVELLGETPIRRAISVIVAPGSSLMLVKNWAWR